MLDAATLVKFMLEIVKEAEQRERERAKGRHEEGG